MLRITLDSITSDQENAWRELAAEAVEPNVFFEADYVLAAARCFPDANVSLLVDEVGGRWDGCLPVDEQRLLGRPLMSTGWKHLYSFLGTPLVRRGRTEDFASSLIGAVRTRQAGLLLSLRNVGEGPVFEGIRAAQEGSDDVRVFRAERTERAALRINGESDAALGMSKKRRKELERLRRRLAEELGVAEITSRRRADDAATVEDFLGLEREGWKGAAGTAMACDERGAEFFRAICRFLAERNRLVIHSLESDGRIAAMTCDFVAGDVLFGFKSAFDEDLKTYSPGVLLQVDNLLATNEEARYELFDSCGDPTNKMLNSVWPDRRGIYSLVLGRRDVLGRAAGRALEARGALRDRRS
jgi:CelD/BcsL family acetyltransferase involved in cellulose biosynthesis